MSLARDPTPLVERVLELAGADGVLAPDRVVRFLQWGLVGAVGVAVDLAVTTSLLGTIHYLLANAAGFAVAVTSNFLGNWLVTYDQPDGSLPRQYASYVLLHTVSFGLRALAVVLLVEAAGAPLLVATVVGIGVAALTNFAGTEGIFRGRPLWFDVVAALNQLAHLVYGSRLRRGLRRVGLYDLLYTAYMRLLGALYRADTHTLSVGPATATISTATPPEVVSVLHTVEKEGPVLEVFVDVIERGDVVWDVGANLGVFATLAADRGAEVVAFEPIGATAAQLRENLRVNGGGRVLGAALSDHVGKTTIALERADLGTQTPALDSDAVATRTEERIDVVDGDTVVEEDFAPPPDVLKVDVEGAEAAVLDGLSETLPDCRVVLVETHGNRAPIEDRLEDAGFAVNTLAATGQDYLIARRTSA